MNVLTTVSISLAASLLNTSISGGMSWGSLQVSIVEFDFGLGKLEGHVLPVFLHEPE